MRSGLTRMSDDPFAPVNPDRRTRRVRGAEFAIVIPVPAGITPAPTSHPKLGKPTQIWTYSDAAGGVLGYIHRYDGKEGKQFRPVTLWRPTGGGKAEWRWESWPAPGRPLYGLARLAERLSALVVVTGGGEGGGCVPAAPAGRRGRVCAERSKERSQG